MVPPTPCQSSSSALCELQSCSRGYLLRQKFKESLRIRLKFFIDNPPKNIELNRIGLLVMRDNQISDEILGMLCGVMTKSVRSNMLHQSFVALFLSQEHLQFASKLVLQIFQKISAFFSNYIDISLMANLKILQSIVNFMHDFTSTKTWSFVQGNVQISQILEVICFKVSTPVASEKFICDLSEVLAELLKETTIDMQLCKSLIEVLVRLLNRIESEFRSRIFALEVLTLPGLLLATSEETTSSIGNEKYFQKVMDFADGNLTELESMGIVKLLNFLANFIHLSFIHREELPRTLIKWMVVTNKLLECCYDLKNKATLSKSANQWHHPILGWVSFRIQEGGHGTFIKIKRQLSFLWSREMVQTLFDAVNFLPNGSDMSNYTVTHGGVNHIAISQNKNQLPSFFQKVLNKKVVRNLFSGTCDQFELSPETPMSTLSRLYENVLRVFTYASIEVTSGLSCHDKILKNLWTYINIGYDDQRPIRRYLHYLEIDSTCSLVHFAPLHLFAELAYMLFTILDEKEMFESEKPFNLEDLKQISEFTNLFCSLAIWNGLIDFKRPQANSLFTSVYQLSIYLYSWDSRRKFTDRDFWITDQIKPSNLISEFEQGKLRASTLMGKMPHIIPLHERIILFRRLIVRDKELISQEYRNHHNPTVITIERSRVIEDGYSQLSNLTAEEIRGTIRVKFINQQGLDEAGIDQDGVFKEFLEVLLTAIFNPELNLFYSTSNHTLYPSSNSFLHKNHLALFQFVGRMLAKAVYEGICIGQHLAPVLLASINEKQLCPFDELSTLDPILYKNLTFIKHYDSGDVEDLDLTFSINEEVMGQVRTVDLITGGRHIKVVNENKILYIHKMAHYQITKTKSQCENFVKGFRSILDPKWLSLFSCHELQTLISGQSTRIDLSDLKKHTHYYGGFHANHRLIRWFWSILEKDFSEEERKNFLRFVTSCSRPPLMGFAYLEPQFSIRCVESSDDLDPGDTVGSVVRGFLAINARKSQNVMRLPTASTCFNLLKLPNYGKRSTLLEKLRYAVHAETGFELS